MIRLAKIAVLAALAAFALIVAYDNVFDYNSNYQFVRHVLSMDTIFPDSVLRSRAIDSQTIWRAGYALIIAAEASTGLLLTLGAVVLFGRLRASAKIFNHAKTLGRGRADTRLLSMVFRFCRDWWRIFCDVAIQALERTGRRLPHRRSDARRIDFRQPARRRARLGTGRSARGRPSSEGPISEPACPRAL